MKIKKLLAGFLAVVVMITTCFIMPVTASADSLWSGSTDLGTEWSVWVTVPGGRVLEGDTITISYTIGTAANYQQLKLLSSSWGALSSIEYDSTENQVEYIEAGTSSYSFVVDADDATSIASSGMVIGGVNLTITDVSVESASAGQSPVPPTGDVTLTTKSAEDSQLTYVDHGNYTTGSSWLVDFKDEITTKAYEANYDSVYAYLQNFDHIEFTVNVSEYSGDVSIPGITIKAHGQSTDWAWYAGDQLMLPLPDVDKDLIYVLPVSELQNVSYNSIGILIDDTTNYNTDGQSASLSYSVGAKLCIDELAPFATSLTVTPDNATINKGETAKFTAVTDVETDIEWGTSNTDVATVSDDGTVTGVGKGISDVIVTINAKFALNRYTEYGQITVTNYATALGIPESVTMGVGTSYHIDTHPTPADVSEFDTQCSIADNTVAKLTLVQNNTFTFEALKVGTTTLTVTDTYSGVTETCTITVTDELASGSYGNDENGATYRQLTVSEADDFNLTKYIVENDITPVLGATYCQYSEGTYRFYALVEESFLADKESASIAIRSNETHKVFELTTTKAYKNLSPTVSAPEGKVFIVFAVKDAPEPVEGLSSHTICNMKWSAIKFTEKEEN